MSDLVSYVLILMARIIVISGFTLYYSLVPYILFYVMIFWNFELLSEISIKCYSIVYFVLFLFIYKFIGLDAVKDEKSVK